MYDSPVFKTEKKKNEEESFGADMTQVIWIGVFQYCFLRVVMTVIAVAAQADGRYCEDSDSPYYAHVWVGPLSILFQIPVSLTSLRSWLSSQLRSPLPCIA